MAETQIRKAPPRAGIGIGAGTGAGGGGAGTGCARGVGAAGGAGGGVCVFRALLKFLFCFSIVFKIVISHSQFAVRAILEGDRQTKF
jgi:hypothetical protein